MAECVFRLFPLCVCVFVFLFFNASLFFMREYITHQHIFE